MSEQAFLKALHVLATLSGTSLTPEVVALYHGSLTVKGFDKAASAMTELAKKTNPRSGLPTVSAIEVMISSGNAISSKFDELVSLISLFGRYCPPAVDASMGKTINRLGGWQKVCDWESSELPYRRKDFDQTYQDVIDALAVGNANAHEFIDLVGEHQNTAAYTPGTAKLKALPGGNVEAKVPEATTIDWDAIRSAHPDLDTHLSEHLKAKGFFKLHSHPHWFFRYCFGAIPGKGWPHSFVDADEHTLKMQNRGHKKEPIDPNRFDSSRYGYEKFND